MTTRLSTSKCCYLY